MLGPALCLGTRSSPSPSLWPPLLPTGGPNPVSEPGSQAAPPTPWQHVSETSMLFQAEGLHWVLTNPRSCRCGLLVAPMGQVCSPDTGLAMWVLPACLSASPLGLLLWFLTSRNGVLQGVFMATAHCCGARSARGCIPRTTSLLCSECLVLLVLPGLPGTQQRESTPAEPGAPQWLGVRLLP